MRITTRQLRSIVRSTINQTNLDRLHESIVQEGPADQPHEPFVQGSVMELVRPVRVTPVAHGDWADLESRGALGWEGGEDSPGSRRQTRPRGITATILKPGTSCKILSAGKNDAWCAPMEPDGSLVVDEKTGNPLKRVKIHINKFCGHCAGVYKAGKPKSPEVRVGSKAGASTPQPSAASKLDRIEHLRAMIAQRQAELDALESETGEDTSDIV